MDHHLRGIVQDCFRSPSNLKFMDVEPGDTILSGRIAETALLLLSHRCWSLAVRHEAPPQRYVSCFSPRAEDKEVIGTVMKEHWVNLIKLEHRRHNHPAAMSLWKDLIVCKRAPIRMIWILYEKDQFRLGSAAGTHLLQGALNILPDNKIVEDGHGFIRKDTKKTGGSKKRSPWRMQFVLANSQILESRGLRHPAAASKADFVTGFRKHARDKSAGRFRPRSHRLPERWANIFGKSKSWCTLTEAALRKDIAAWIWLQEGFPALVPTQGISLNAALFSKLCVVGFVVKAVANGSVYVSLGNAAWAFLAWQCVLLRVGDNGMQEIQPDPLGQAVFLHVVAPRDWEVIPYVACAVEGDGIVLKQTGPADSLIKACISARNNGLLHEDLVRISISLGLNLSTSSSREILLRAIAAKVSDDPLFATQVIKLEKGKLGFAIPDPF